MRRPDEYATKPSRHYATDSHLVLEQRDEGSHRSPRSVTTMTVRRVVPSGGSEELQVEITIDKIGEKRTNQAFGHLTLTPALADELAAACASIRDGSTADADAALIATIRRSQQKQKADRIVAILREPDL